MRKLDIEFIQKTYKGKKVLVTGHTGFKGSWLITWLSMLDAEIKGYSLEPEHNFDLYNQIAPDIPHVSVIGDIRDKDRFAKEIVDFAPDFIFHLAAQPLVRYSYEHPVETYETNVIGTVNLLAGMKKLTKKCTAILITTDKVYQNNEWDYPYRENDRLGGFDPYSSSKACCEILIDSFSNSFFNKSNYHQHGISIASARAGNVIGGGDWSADRIVPDIIRALSEDRPIQLRNPNSIRPWQHVMEPIGAYLLLAATLHENYTIDRSWNFGPETNDILTVEELVKHAIKSWGQGGYESIKTINSPHEAGLLMLDISKAQRHLKWQPKYKAEKAIEIAVEWYKNHLDQVSAVELIQKDIENYIKY